MLDCHPEETGELPETFQTNDCNPMAEENTPVILKKTSLLWPILLFPHCPRSHTVACTGRRLVKDVRFSAGFATLTLTVHSLRCRLVFPHLRLWEVQLGDITHLSRLKGKEELVEIRFAKSKTGWLTRLVLSGAPAIPRDRVLLNLGDDAETWFQELNRRITTGAVALGGSG